MKELGHADMKKVILLLAGQLRTFDNPYVQQSWEKFRSVYDVTTIGCFWDNRGSSRYEGDRSMENEVISLDRVKQVLRTDHIKLFNYQDFIENITPNFQKYYGARYFDCIISNSFLRYQVGKYLKEMEQYERELFVNFDLAILTRADLIFLRKLPDYIFEDTSVVWHQNGVNSKAYHQDRVYDMILMSNVKNILQFCQFHYDEDSNYCIDKPSHNGLELMDSTRIYYNYMNQKNVKVESLDLLHADAFRTDADIQNYSSNYLNNKELWGVTS